jgi:hypothetical protein
MSELSGGKGFASEGAMYIFEEKKKLENGYDNEKNNRDDVGLWYDSAGR